MKNKSFMPSGLDENEGEGVQDDEDDIHMNEKAICKVCNKEGN